MVRFCEDTEFEKTTEKCSKCQYRNIRPYTRNMSNCISCRKQYCGFCMGTLMLCMKCYISYIPDIMKNYHEEQIPRNLHDTE